MNKENIRRRIRNVTAFAAAVAMAATFTFPTEIGEGFFDGFGNAIVASAAETLGKCGTNLTWTFDGTDTLTISGTGEMTNWDRSWDVPWCDFRDKIKSVVIKNGVTSIGEFAFSGCASLTSITIPGGVTSIGADAFFDCTSLASITIPNSVTSIGYAAFMQCESLASITIPNSVTSIGNSAFYFCKSLTSIAIPYRVTSIGDSAFGQCTRLASITIPEGVTSIGKYAFTHCTSLASITIPEGVTSIGDNAFEFCTSLTSIAIPGSVTSIGEYAFYCCESLTSITIPGSVTSIGEYAFYCCGRLTSITIPDSVTSIGNTAFRACTSLTSIFIPYSLNVSSAGIPDTTTQIKYTVDTGGNVTITGATAGTEQISLTIPENIGGKAVTSIGDSAFSGCTSLTSITIPNSINSIGYGAFYNCTSLESIFLPKSLYDIGEDAIPSSAAQIKYTVESERTVINEVKLGTYQTDCLLPATLFEKPVYLADESLETCPNVSHVHREKTAATCTAKAVCVICETGYGETEAHSLKKHDAVHASCTTDGNIEYYECNVCDKLFTDESGTTETTLEAVTILAAGHSFGIACDSNAGGHYYVCTVCDEKSDIEEHIKGNGTVIKEATPTENGTITYKCIVCGAKAGEETITATISSFEVTASNVIVYYTVPGSTEEKSQKYDFYEVTEEMVELMKSKDIKHVIDFVNYSTAGSDTIILTAAQMKAIEYVLAHDYGM